MPGGLLGDCKLLSSSVFWLDEVVVQDAAIHDRAPELRIATMANRLPERVAGALEVFLDFGVDLVTGGGL